ncbi:MAG: outer membrane beta-barrel protein [Myxococcales bacterium]
MRYFLGLGFGLFVLVSGGRASAQEAPRARPFEIGVSSGYSAVGLGSRLSYADIDSLWEVPLLIDVGYRVSKHFSVGAYGEVGFIDSTSDSVEDAEESLDGHHYRLGVEAIYHSAPERHVQPWLGVGLGYDTLRLNYHFRSTFPPFGNEPPDPGSSTPIRASGFELGHVQLGIDFALVPWLSFGPYVGASVVDYSKRRGFAEPSEDDFSVWSTIALKATLRL